MTVTDIIRQKRGLYDIECDGEGYKLADSAIGEELDKDREGFEPLFYDPKTPITGDGATVIERLSHCRPPEKPLDVIAVRQHRGSRRGLFVAIHCRIHESSTLCYCRQCSGVPRLGVPDPVSLYVGSSLV